MHIWISSSSVSYQTIHTETYKALNTKICQYFEPIRFFPERVYCMNYGKNFHRSSPSPPTKYRGRNVGLGILDAR